MITRTTIATLAVLGATAGPAWGAPANDDWEHAAALGAAPAAADGTIDGATAEPGDPDRRPNVWYAYRPAADGPVAVELPHHDGSVAFPPVVYTGAIHGALEELPVRRDQWYSRTRFDAVAGQTYWIEVRGYRALGDFRLAVRPLDPPANDDFADARRLDVPGVYTGFLEQGTTELDEPPLPPGGSASTVWFSIRPKHSSRLTVDPTGSSASTQVDAYTGSHISSLHRVASAGVVRFQAQRGRTYRLRLTSFGGNTGDYGLDVSDGSIAGKGVHMTVRPGQTVGSVRRHGVRLDVGARRKVGVDIDLLVSKATAHRLHLRSTRIGHVGGQLGYHQDVPATVALNSAARRALARHDHLRATLRLTLRSSAPDRVLTVPVRL